MVRLAGVYTDSGSLAAIHEALPAAPRVAARERRAHLAAGGDHRAHLPCFTHRWRICSGRSMSSQ